MAAVLLPINHNSRHRVVVVVSCCYALLLLLSTACCTASHAAAAAEAEEEEEASSGSGGYRTFIVLLERPTTGGPMDAPAHRAWHESFLPSKLTELGEPRLLRSYRFIVNGFAARLTEAELQQVSSKPGFVAAFPNGIRHLQTTHTPQFLGLLDSGAGRVATWNDSNYGAGKIIGVIDGGIWARHPSMGDVVFPNQVPARWKGSCPKGFGCNRKLIGAKNMVHQDTWPDDIASGHGTHTTSIAAGSFLQGVSYSEGLAMGTASGTAPWSHVAIYKVCYQDNRCTDDAIIHAMDEAIHDGVDVISLSIGIGTGVRTTYDRDVVAIAAYSAMEMGVPVVACAGNGGPADKTVMNEAPWLFTVGAGTIDRRLEARVLLPGGGTIVGESVADRKAMALKPGSLWYPILYRDDAERRYCLYPEAEKQTLFRDRIVLCEAGQSTTVGGDPIEDAVTKYHAAGAISIDRMEDGYTFAYRSIGLDHPIVQVSYDDGQQLKSYASAWPGGRVSLQFGDTLLGYSSTKTPAPIVASFSGRGPSKRSPGIMKPDIIAPGVNILAGLPYSYIPFGFMSGTSMATPHVSGLVALFRTLHPQMSPAAIRSAFVTTADVMDNTGNRIQDEQRAGHAASAYATGAGHINVGKALDPGLVYDLNPQMYAVYVCNSLGGDAALRRLTRDNSRKCAGYLPLRESELNYPTITSPLQPTPFSVFRMVTNVSPLGPEVYTITVAMPPGVTVTVNPTTLAFGGRLGEMLVYVLTINSTDNTPVNGQVFQGSVTLTSTLHTVRSPLIAVVGLPNP